MAQLSTQHLTVYYPIRCAQRDSIALQSIGFSTASGQFIHIIGRNGCGKNTLLNVIAGLVPCTSGQVMLNGNIIRDPAYERTMIFQAASLIPWHTMIENAAFV